MTQAKVKKLERLFAQLTPEEQAEFGQEAFPNLFAAGTTHMAQRVAGRQALEKAAQDITLLMAWCSGMAVGMGNAGAIQPQMIEILDRLQRKLERLCGKNKLQIAELVEAINMFRTVLHEYIHVRGKTRAFTEYGQQAFLSFLHYLNGRLQ